MRNVIRSSQFIKDYKRLEKRGVGLPILVLVVTALVKEGRISARFRPHKLQGSYSGYWECHLMSRLAFSVRIVARYGIFISHGYT